MERPCYNCGQVVEEGIPFCPHCAAPQIRVMIAEPAPARAPAPDLALLPSESPSLPASQTVPVLAIPMRWSEAVRPCALAALIAALAMVLKLMVPLIAALGAGFLAVAFYRRRNPEVAIHAGAGARLGALCGLFCFAMSAVLGAVRVLILHEGNEIRKMLLEAIQQAAINHPDPQLQPSLDFLRSPGGLVVMLACLLVFGLVMLLILGALGGALGGAVLSRRSRN
jgi:hypothetical protein